MNQLKLLLLSACAVALIGCSSSDDSGSGDGVAAIAGLWDISDNDPQFGEDVFYIRIEANGQITDIDFQGDEFDGGENCYLIANIGMFTAIGGNQYQYFLPSGQLSETITAVRNGNTLAFTSLDVFDEDEDGDTTDTFTEFFPMVTGVDPVFPQCS